MNRLFRPADAKGFVRTLASSVSSRAASVMVSRCDHSPDGAKGTDNPGATGGAGGTKGKLG